MALTKADMAENLLAVVGLSRKESKEVVELFFDQICESLRTGQQVKLSGFGNFELHDKGERPGRNPKTGASIPVSARRVVTFHSGQKLKTRVERYSGAPPESESDTDTEK